MQVYCPKNGDHKRFLSFYSGFAIEKSASQKVTKTSNSKPGFRSELGRVWGSFNCSLEFIKLSNLFTFAA